jgi:hypothetical protein
MNSVSAEFLRKDYYVFATASKIEKSESRKLFKSINLVDVAGLEPATSYGEKLIPVTALSNVIGQPMARIRQGSDDPIVAQPHSRLRPCSRPSRDS